jgi:hypothetical protein
MLRSKIGVWRLLALVAVVLLIQAHTASSVMVASTQGREQADCVQLCNSIEDGCKDTCRDDCKILCALSHPVPSPEFNACVDACVEPCASGPVNSCASDKQECKAKCNVNRPTPSPTEP